MFQPTQPSVSASRQSEDSLVGNKRNRNNHPIDTILLLLEANQYIGQHFLNLPQGRLLANQISMRNMIKQIQKYKHCRIDTKLFNEKECVVINL